MAPLKKVWDQASSPSCTAWATPTRRAPLPLDGYLAHLRPEKVGTQVGWARWRANTSQEGERRHGRKLWTCLFRALVAPGVPVACVAGPLEKYGFLPNIQERTQRLQVLDSLREDVRSRGGTGVMEYLGTTGLDSLKGADILKVAPEKYASTVKYPDTPIARKLRGIAQVHFADLGSRIFYCDHGSFDTHAGQNPGHGQLWSAVCEGLEAFMADLHEHDHADNVIILLFSEFGRRVHDNGSGTDHGAAGPAFILGDKVKGGHYGEYPSLKRKAGSGRPEPEYGLPQHLLDDSREVAEVGSQTDHRWPV